MDTITIYQWIILSLTAICIGMSKIGIQGMMLLVVSSMVLAFGAKESTGIILPMLCIADIIAVAYYKRIADWKIILKLLPTAIIGFFLAILVDNMIEKNQFRQLMGWTLLIILSIMLWNEIFGKENRLTNKWWYSTLFGLLGGFTTMIGNAAGPVMSVYLLSMRKKKIEFVGINAWFFLVINLLKVPLQIFLWNNINIHTFSLNLLMLPFIVIGAIIGIYIVRILPEKTFKWFIMTVTFFSVITILIS